MDVKINRPPDVYERIGKAHSTLVVYSDLVKSCDKELVSLGLEIEQYASELQRKQREAFICLESLNRSFEDNQDSQEAEEQRKKHLATIQSCRRKREGLRMLNEELATLNRESQKLHQDAVALADRIKPSVIAVRRVIEKYIAST